MSAELQTLEGLLARLLLHPDPEAHLAEQPPPRTCPRDPQLARTRAPSRTACAWPRS
ncbi:MAG: hypothetical protein R3E96_02445 [Planctomycetota bacterium]